MTNGAHYGSRFMGQDEFVSAVEQQRYSNAEFHHPDHIRLAWIYVRRYGPHDAEQRIAQTIRQFAISLGHEEKYHETQTRAWFRLVAVAEHLTPDMEAFDEFLAKHPWLLDRGALSAFYSRERLASEESRFGWTEPDRRPLPRLAADGGLHLSATSL